MEIVADTNIFLAVALNEPHKESIIELTSDAELIAPDVLPYEIGNALSAMVKRRQVSGQAALAAYSKIGKIPVRLIGVEVRLALKLAIEQNIYAYDAYFLQCARSISSPLLTLDRKMRIAATELKIQILE